MDSLEQRKSMLLDNIPKLKMELGRLNLPGTTEPHLEMKVGPNLGGRSPLL